MKLRSATVAVAATWLGASLLLFSANLGAQQPEGPQTSAPPPVAPTPPPARVQGASSNEKILIPAGTRIGVVLENGISTRSAKPGDSVYLQTSFPITQNNRIVIPVGSYLRGEIINSKRPGKIKGKGEFRLRLNTLILPNGYTVNLNAAPRSADSGGKETMDSEGKVTALVQKGKTPVRSRRRRRRAQGSERSPAGASKGRGSEVESARLQGWPQYYCRVGLKRNCREVRRWISFSNAN